MSLRSFRKKYFYCYRCEKLLFKNEVLEIKNTKFVSCKSCGNNIFISPQIDKLDEDWPILMDLYDRNLFHFTDRSNLPSIVKYGGLYSSKYLEESKIEVCQPGGDELSRELDSKRSLQDYCRLSFYENHPMLDACIRDGRIFDPVILEIEPIVMFFESTIFYDMNATDQKAKRYNNFVEFCDGYSARTENSDKLLNYKYEQAEILVKKHIPIKLFSKKTQEDIIDIIKNNSL